MSDSPPQGSDGPLKRQSASSSKFKPYQLAKASNDMRRHSDGSTHNDSKQSHSKERSKTLNRNSDATSGEKRRKNSRRKHSSSHTRRSPSRLHFIESPTTTTTENTTERPSFVSTMPLRTRSARAPRLRASPASPASHKTKLEPIPEFTSLRPKQHWSNCLPDSILNSPSSDDESSISEATAKQIVLERSASAPTSIEPVVTVTPDRDAKGRMRRRARPYFVSRRTFAKRPSSEPIAVGASSSSTSSTTLLSATSSSSRFSVPPLPAARGNTKHTAAFADDIAEALRRRRASDGGDVCLASPDRDIEFLDEIITAVKDNHDLPLLEPRQRSNSIP
eukprot:CAMPEP_0168584730 /NCGR_PEP_ID=MMETSP0420-20121227/3301_1 /TAXON_ID=498008 /ORGANISM="Pessonella sp." /LENGTH=334 /DNA_ID=CAMNT_0008619563 /DNA_START=365 /DNA_END=1369 /DNA_ORIENTATION=+